MTQAQRFRYYAKSMVSPEAILRAAAGAGLQQWTNTPPEWGQGPEGYWRRFDNSFGEHLMRQTITYGLSSILDEDNRFFRSEQGGFGRRTMYAVESTVMARHPDGTRHISYSRLGGLIATALISRSWQPPSVRGYQHAVGSFGTAFGTEVGFNVIRELIPNLLHRH
jgi:hypothetical protein